MSTGFQRANQAAGQVYNRFMHEVLEQYVLNERIGHPLTDKQKREIHNAKAIDIRSIHLMSISGKGGWHPDPEKWERYQKNQNITLLDHLLSVVRGALLLAALDWLQDNPEMEEETLQQRLTIIAVIGFLHDLDKMLQLPRDEPLTEAHVESALQRYGLDKFLAAQDLTLDAAQARFLIEQAEDSQRYRNPVTTPRAWKHAVERYVKLADKLDGIWQQHGAQGGLEAIIQRLNKEQSLHSPLLTQWHIVDIFDPHHPCLLDELQQRLSIACQRLAKIPPLLEIHQDGRLFMLLPQEQAKVIQQKGIQGLVNRALPFDLELNISTRGIPELLNGQPTHTELQAFLHSPQTNRKELGKLFCISNALIAQITEPMDACLNNLGLAPQWPAISGQTSTPYPDPDALDNQALSYFLQAAHLMLLFNLKLLPIMQKNGLPSYAQREQQLLALLDSDAPVWITEIIHDLSRRSLLSLWLTAQAAQNTELQQHIWGEQGVLQQWLEGLDSDEQPIGFNQYFAGQGVAIKHAVGRHFEQLLRKQRVHPDNEVVAGRCLFTDEPSDTWMESNLKLYEVKVSAFSGREGKPDSITAPAKGRVPISYVSLAEHKMRDGLFKQQGGKPSGVPSLVSSPVTTGLFSALILKEEQQFSARSVYDLSRSKIEKGKINYRGLEAYRSRHRIARLERIPEKLSEQINLLRLLLRACLRIGRPIHVFKGLPTPQKAFFYFDALPTTLKYLMGDNALRLEQIPSALEHLERAQTLIDTHGLGHDVLSLYAFPNTRFSAICLAWCHTRDQLKDISGKTVASLTALNKQLLQEFHHDLNRSQTMSESAGALVRLGQAATRIQRRPLGQASNNEELLVFNLCLQSATALRAIGQTDNTSLIYGIAGELETNLVRKDKAAAKQHRNDTPLAPACLTFAEQFVNEVWQGVLNGRPPAQKNRRLLGSIYRMAFLQTFRTDTSQG